MSSYSDSVSLSISGSGSERSGVDGSSQSTSSDREQLGRSAKRVGGKQDVDGGARKDIMASERVNVVECVCKDREGATEEFFYMYMCHFSQLHIRLPFDEFTIGGGRSHFYTDDGSTKFSFYWTSNPWRYKGMTREELSVADKEVVRAVMQFSNKMPTKGLVRVYNLVHPIIDIEGHMVQMGKKNLTFFQTLRKEKAAKAKDAGSTEKVELSTKPCKGKDVKKVWATLLGPGSSSGGKGLEAGLIELPKTIIRCDIEINVSETLINLIDSMEPNALVMSMVEFNSKALILGRKVGSLYQRELKEGIGRKLRSYRDSEEKFKVKIANLEANYNDLKEKHKGLEVKLEDLKGCIIQEHINGFQKGLRQAAFFCKDVDVADPRFDVNKDVVDGQLISEVETSLEEEAEKTVVDEYMNVEEDVEGGDDQAAYDIVLMFSIHD
ncbi:hypothetical protein DEO72_LG3g899 [Vigna unguiculata]|uniref:Transposase n=1 Tax=Vigna unguiculata TaxID=3917 RepID=A0A4D6LCY5_VIGUN|nr:hypothetical protein DEO72_LG3g899 [Vigna unguiculata]